MGENDKPLSGQKMTVVWFVGTNKKKKRARAYLVIGGERQEILGEAVKIKFVR
jgi:hypothetical protein